ncbi:MAG: acyl-CoA dehydrogenase, partial [Rhodanobacteraceae bacterium]
VEETGIAQHYRDARITTIYEGTTGIQALDLVGRKLIRDMGATATAVIGEMQSFADSIARDDPHLTGIGESFGKAVATLAEVSQWIGMNAMSDLHKAFACSVPYLRLWGVVAAGRQMARAAQIASERLGAGSADEDFYRAKLATAKFYSTHVLSQSAWLKRQILDGSGDVMTLSEEGFDLDRRAAVPA